MNDPAAATVLPFDRKPPPFERRRNDRVSAPSIRARPGSDRLEIVDMSQRGMAIKALHPFSIGGNYLFELLEGGRSLIIEARVCWSRREAVPQVQHPTDSDFMFRTGVAFVGIQNQSVVSTTEELARFPKATTEAQQSDEQIIADRIARLRRSDSPDESAELLLELLSADFAHLVLFRLKGQKISAWMGRGPTLVPDRLMKLRLRVDQTSIFQHLGQGGSFFYGRLPAMFAHLQLLSCWDGSLHRDCALFPIRLRDRLVAFLYADVGDQTLVSQHLATLKQATDLFARSLLEQILRRKRSREMPD